MSELNYQAVSMAMILRDYAQPKYINAEHKMLVDIADTLYNANLGPEYLKPEYRELYDKYGKEFFNLVLKDAYAIDSQLGDSDLHRQELLEEYADYIKEA